MKEFGVPSSLIITFNESKKIEVDKGTINMVPAWQRLLGKIYSLFPISREKTTVFNP